jgi:hypothetical protein
MVLASLVVLLVGPLAAAHATTPEPVTIQSTVQLGTFTGTWSATGAINDSGTLVEPVVISTDSHQLHIVRVNTSGVGSFTLRIDSTLTSGSPPDSGTFVGRWVVVSGTGAYATLHGEGTRDATVNNGVVTETLTGTMHLD